MLHRYIVVAAIVVVLGGKVVAQTTDHRPVLELCPAHDAMRLWVAVSPAAERAGVSKPKITASIEDDWRLWAKIYRTKPPTLDGNARPMLILRADVSEWDDAALRTAHYVVELNYYRLLTSPDGQWSGLYPVRSRVKMGERAIAVSIAVEQSLDRLFTEFAKEYLSTQESAVCRDYRASHR